MTQRSVVLLGSTGSIGTQAIDVIQRHADRYRVTGIAAGGSDPQAVVSQAKALGVGLVALARTSNRDEVASQLPGVEVIAGDDAATRAAGMGADVVLNGITGSVGLDPTLAALEVGSTVALANKESLVAGGTLVKRAIRRPDQLVPVDSEHSALAQALRGGTAAEVTRLVITASGGAFRGMTRSQLSGVTVDQALKHPTWDMGPVVTINSASMMNKALEVIEAHVLFDIPMDRIQVVVHPQSVVHSMVEFIDGSTLAQASPPDMRLPIALGLSWPDRLADVAPPVDWSQPYRWDFEPLDEDAFPAIWLARQAVAASPLHPAVMNAANEECVQAFVEGRLAFLDIVDTVRRVVEDFEAPAEMSREAVAHAEALARQEAQRLIGAA